ncbi:leukocyte elastase inhibitor-like isoform X2 [Panulirus ornatus]|uniref:leukocyte elastase inhibitor-like isoform X2 n=2 Tax=Panulirus ornatus TaxID=150431 RepID=UPI003A8479B7
MSSAVVTTTSVVSCCNYRQFIILFATVAAMETAAFGQQHQTLPSLPAYAHQEDVSTLATSQNKFTRDLYVKLGSKSSGNLFFSPFSIMTALGMTYTGAAGNTEQEMHSVMHLAQDKETLHNAFQDVVKDLKTEVAEYELSTSNMAYVSNKLTLLTDYVNTLKENYLSSVKTVNFDEAENVRQEINSLVEKDTNSRIKDLIPSGILDNMTRMVLVNAVYFKGLWEHQFLKSATYDQEFWTSESDSIKVPMMHIKDHFRIFHHRNLGAMLLAMDYKGSRLSMVFVLPDKRSGLAEVEAKLAEFDLNEIDKRLRRAEVEVTLPKFKLEESLDLVACLNEMGMKDLFNERTCDLSGISGTKDLYVSNVIHKAFLEVNEEGSEAAAATGVVAATRMLIRPIPPFIADHPFIFYLRDQRSGLLLFAGRLVKP